MRIVIHFLKHGRCEKCKEIPSSPKMKFMEREICPDCSYPILPLVKFDEKFYQYQITYGLLERLKRLEEIKMQREYNFYNPHPWSDGMRFKDTYDYMVNSSVTPYKFMSGVLD